MELTVIKDLRIHKDIRIVICEDCGLVFNNPGPNEEGYLAFYKGTIDPKLTFPPKESIIRKKRSLAILQIQYLKDCLENLSQLNAVDVGTGWGGFLYFLKPEVKSLAATEVMPSAKTYIEREFGCPVYVTNRLSDVFAKNSVDLITATALIEHYTDPISGLQDMAYVLKPGGKLFLFTPDIKGMCFAQGIEQFFKFLHPYYYSVNTLRGLLSRTGFSDFRFWCSKPDYSRRSIRNSAHITSGNILMLATKNDKSGVNNVLFRDDPNEILEIFKQRLKIEEIYHKRRKIWLSPWLKPIRGIARLIPKQPIDIYKPMLDQYLLEKN